jgi:hypothetical protein
MASDKELDDTALTHVSGWSLSIEHYMATHRQFQGSIGIDNKDLV